MAGRTSRRPAKPHIVGDGTRAAHACVDALDRDAFEIGGAATEGAFSFRGAGGRPPAKEALDQGHVELPRVEATGSSPCGAERPDSVSGPWSPHAPPVESR